MGELLHLTSSTGKLKLNRTRSAVHDVLPTSRPDPTHIAIVLNANARKVTPNLIKKAGSAIGTDHVFYTRNLSEAEDAARLIVQRGYGTVLCGGGDGTLNGVANMVRRYLDQANHWRRERYERHGDIQSLLTPPRFGFLKLGTGNALAPIVGARSAMKDLRLVARHAPAYTYEVPLIKWGEERFFFGGVGYDAMILNDYNTLKNRIKSPIFKPFTRGLLGYFIAGLFRSLPRALQRDLRIPVQIRSHGTAYYLDPRRGDSAIPMPPGSILYEGDATFMAAGTTPFYGYGMQIFPFAGITPNTFHLRVANIGPIRGLNSLSSIWQGHYRDPHRVFDFLVHDVELRLGRPGWFQHSGDPQGQQTQLRWTLSDEPLELVDFYANTNPTRAGFRGPSLKANTELPSSS